MFDPVETDGVYIDFVVPLSATVSGLGEAGGGTDFRIKIEIGAK